MPPRANIFTATGRWIAGIGARERKEPWTGQRQVRFYRESTWWSPDGGGRGGSNRIPAAVRKSFAAAGRGAVGASTGIGTGGRIGSEGIGTTTGTAMHEVSSAKASSNYVGVGGAIGEARIGGADTVKGGKGRFVAGGNGG